MDGFFEDSGGAQDAGAEGVGGGYGVGRDGSVSIHGLCGFGAETVERDVVEVLLELEVLVLGGGGLRGCLGGVGDCVDEGIYGRASCSCC